MNDVENFTKVIEEVDGFQPHLFEGATEKELRAAEETLNIVFPTEFKEFYQTYNGQNECADALFDGFYLCSLEQMLHHWSALKDNEKEFLQIESESSSGIKKIWGCSKWVPFASTADGHYLCMDFSPTEAGTIGQIITFWYNSPERERIAPSFKDFILEYTEKIRNGIYVYKQTVYKDITLGRIARKDGYPMFETE